MDPLERIRERVRQGREARARELQAQRIDGGAAVDRLGAPFRPDTVVVDLVTGQKGVVVGHTRENVLVPAPPR